MAQVVYELSFRGRATDTLAQAFDGYPLSRRRGVTVLRSTLPDQAALHGLINRIQGMGLELLEIRRVPQSAEHDVNPPAR